MTDTTKKSDDRKPDEVEALDRPRLIPQGHASGTAAGEDSTDPHGGAKEGQSDSAAG